MPSCTRSSSASTWIGSSSGTAEPSTASPGSGAARWTARRDPGWCRRSATSRRNSFIFPGRAPGGAGCARARRRDRSSSAAISSFSQPRRTAGGGRLPSGLVLVEEGRLGLLRLGVLGRQVDDDLEPLAPLLHRLHGALEDDLERREPLVDVVLGLVTQGPGRRLGIVDEGLGPPPRFAHHLGPLDHALGLDPP